MAPLLTVDTLRTIFETDKETIRAVDGVSFSVNRGETVGIVGESGSGKSVTARSIMGLIDTPGRIDTESSIRFDGTELLADSTDWADIRGNRIAMIFQDPMTSFNPVYTVGNQIKEAIRLHRDLGGRAVSEEATRLLRAVGIPDASKRLREYPHEYSGGMLQRAVIAMALASDPDLLICDEPTTALDVTIQRQVLELLADLQVEQDLAMIFITHDMGVISEVADRINVMYAGEIVERGHIEDVFQNPAHPYTEGLLACIPSRNTGADRLATIDGQVPTPTAPPQSCRFAPRCPKAHPECHEVHPVDVPVNDSAPDSHHVSCLLYPDDSPKDKRIQQHIDAEDDTTPPAPDSTASQTPQGEYQ